MQGYQIDETIGNSINENKKNFFQELDTPSLKKISRYCYSNTYDRCCGTNGCYFCVIIDYVHEGFHRKREINSVCPILHQAKTVASVMTVRTVINSIISCKFYFIFM